MNLVTFGADTAKVQPRTDSYFVRLGQAPPAPVGSAGPAHRTPTARRQFEPSRGPRRRRRRRFQGRSLLLVVLLFSVAGWGFWASRRPGGVSGTINGWIENVRGDVAKVSSDPDLSKAANTFNAQYAINGSYPQLTEDQLTTAGIGIGITVDWCGTTAVVLQGSAGGGDVSHLLLKGFDLGAVQGRHDCPSDLDAPAPWKAR